MHAQPFDRDGWYLSRLKRPQYEILPEPIWLRCGKGGEKMEKVGVEKSDT